MTVDVDLAHVVGVLFVGLLHGKVTLPLPFPAVRIGSKCICEVHTSGAGVILPSSRLEFLRK